MESIKTTLGLGPTDSSSFQEPLSGETGAGTATDPYDAGNASECSFLPAEQVSLSVFWMK